MSDRATEQDTIARVFCRRVLGIDEHTDLDDHAAKRERTAVLSEVILGHGWQASTEDQLAALRALTVGQAFFAEGVENIARSLRRNGASWASVADALGISKQAAQQRYGRN